MIEVPLHVENEDAYIAGAYARIARNARKTTDKRIREDADFAAVARFIFARGEFANADTFFGSLFKAYDERGKWTDKQIEAVRKIMAKEVERKAEARQRDAGSVFVGTIGKRETFTLTLTGTFNADTMYGTQYTHFMKDAAGNVVIYRGTKSLDMAKGETKEIVASVKSHYERDGVKQTYITRAKLA